MWFFISKPIFLFWYRFPLYSRTTIPSNPVLFAISLLNQNIVQLFYQLTSKNLEYHKTLPNLHSLLSTTMDKYKYSRVKHDSTSSSHGEDQHLLHFHQSNDSALNLKDYHLSTENGEYESLKKNSSSMRWVEWYLFEFSLSIGFVIPCRLDYIHYSF